MSKLERAWLVAVVAALVFALSALARSYGWAQIPPEQTLTATCSAAYQQGEWRTDAVSYGLSVAGMAHDWSANGNVVCEALYTHMDGSLWEGPGSGWSGSVGGVSTDHASGATVSGTACCAPYWQIYSARPAGCWSWIYRYRLMAYLWDEQLGYALVATAEAASVYYSVVVPH